ncbi:Fur family transcriptional regulator [Thiomicrorhabdus cannonii]|uniref:Fur family transcriptional regulator n=1 Tax=Thiomicrorhabdus cannonii TaxID=2748011 RepID=UPI0015C15A82|nr:Fur family transcriptional regulator [Thiomicrorhabdus cannonii]
MDTHSRQMAQLEEQCRQAGKKLTPIRQQVLQLMLQHPQPQSAYEILQAYQSRYNPKAQPMTVYRALNFLEEIDAVHRLASTRQYVVCDHLGREHTHHGFTQFLLCDRCGGLQEVEMEQAVWQKLLAEAAIYHFTPNASAIEIHGVCGQCQNPA